MSLRRVLLIGATGTLGQAILSALQEAGGFEITLLRRANASSPSHPDNTLREILVDPAFPLDQLESAFQDQDAVIAAFRLSDLDQHLRLVEAAYRAGVKRYIPADFGSCDAASPRAQALLQLYRDKTMVRDKCEALAASPAAGPFSWTAVVCGHFFDFALHHLDFGTRVARLLDGGGTPASSSTFRQIGQATAAVLRRPEETRNRAVFVQSFCPTQKEVVAAVERITGQSWRTEDVDSKAFLDEKMKRVEEGDKKAVEDVVYVIGTLEADWRKKDDFAMDLLGLEDEDLDVALQEELAKRKGM